MSTREEVIQLIREHIPKWRRPKEDISTDDLREILFFEAGLSFEDVWGLNKRNIGYSKVFKRLPVSVILQILGYADVTNLFSSLFARLNYTELGNRAYRTKALVLMKLNFNRVSRYNPKINYEKFPKIIERILHEEEFYQGHRRTSRVTFLKKKIRYALVSGRFDDLEELGSLSWSGRKHHK